IHRAGENSCTRRACDRQYRMRKPFRRPGGRAAGAAWGQHVLGAGDRGMAIISQERVKQFLCGLAVKSEGVCDSELLGRFRAGGDEAAFTALVKRHGPMVLGVSHRVLRHRQDAEDAFQATFLVLARKAGAIGDPATLANWLYGVAYRTSLKARSTIAK